MPLLWCGVLIILYFALIAAEFPLYSALTAAILALGLSVSGMAPWIQVLIFLVTAAILSLLQHALRKRCRNLQASTWAVVRSVETVGYTVYYQGRVCQAQAGCPAAMPEPGTLVRVIGATDDHLYICTK